MLSLEPDGTFCVSVFAHGQDLKIERDVNEGDLVECVPVSA